MSNTPATNGATTRVVKPRAIKRRPISTIPGLRKVDANEVMAMFRCGRNTVSGWQKTRGFPKGERAGNKVLFDLDAIEAWHAAQQTIVAVNVQRLKEAASARMTGVWARRRAEKAEQVAREAAEATTRQADERIAA